MVVTMKTRMSEKKSRIPPALPPKPLLATLSPSPAPSSNSSSPVRGPDYRFSFGQLPDWAKKQMTGESGPVTKKQPMALPQGKWSERVEQASGSMTIKSFYDSDTVVSVPFTKPPPPPPVTDSPGESAYEVSSIKGQFSSGFNPPLGTCNPGTQKPDFRQLFDEVPQILTIFAKITNIFSRKFTFFEYIIVISIFYA
jgi:hypothetical protein